MSRAPRSKWVRLMANSSSNNSRTLLACSTSTTSQPSNNKCKRNGPSSSSMTAVSSSGSGPHSHSTSWSPKSIPTKGIMRKFRVWVRVLEFRRGSLLSWIFSLSWSRQHVQWLVFGGLLLRVGRLYICVRWIGMLKTQWTSILLQSFITPQTSPGTLTWILHGPDSSDR